jgi:ankyrin repeat protein
VTCDRSTAGVFAQFSYAFHLTGTIEVVQKISKEGDSRLHWALRSRYLQAIMLLAQIEEINQNNCENETALDLAIQTNQIEAIMLLFRLGAHCGKSKLGQ